MIFFLRVGDAFLGISNTLLTVVVLLCDLTIGHIVRITKSC